MSTNNNAATTLTPAERDELLDTLRERFDNNPRRHEGLHWDDVAARLHDQPAKLRSLHLMESSGGEPDVTGRDAQSGAFIFTDCSRETPAGRRNCCYDRTAQEGRKEHAPSRNALDWAAELGITLLTEDEYHALQTLGEFDLKTSSWIATPAAIRARGGALFCDRRYDHVFVYHNGADSYYKVRGFRGSLRA